MKKEKKKENHLESYWAEETAVSILGEKEAFANETAGQTQTERDRCNAWQTRRAEKEDKWRKNMNIMEM